MIFSPSPVQQTLTLLTGLCASLAQDCNLPSATLLLSESARKHLGNRDAIGFPNAESAQRWRVVGSAAVVGGDGTIWGMLVVSGDKDVMLNKDRLDRLMETAEMAALRLDSLLELLAARRLTSLASSEGIPQNPPFQALARGWGF